MESCPLSCSPLETEENERKGTAPASGDAGHDHHDEHGSSDSDSLPPNMDTVQPVDRIPERQPILLLSLDGGGIRGLSSIIILERIMAEFNKDRTIPLQPYQVFSMIGGTSTGGLIALMLGRLRMTIDEVKEAYIDISQEAFRSSRYPFDPRRILDFFTFRARFSGKALTKAIKETISRSGNSPECRLLEYRATAPENGSLEEHGARKHDCKTFVCTVHQGNASLAILSDYESPHTFEDQPRGLKVWEAARATSAATSFFPAMEIRSSNLKMGYVDSGVVSNNPIHTVWNQAHYFWPLDEYELFLLSIGTGVSSDAKLSGGLNKITKALIKLATETERTADEFSEDHHHLIKEELFFRFNVTQGLQDIQLDEAKNMNTIVEATLAYLHKPMVANMVTRCVKRIKEKM
ncbi:uncharacterized protein PV07_03827 [Cladophialophora immunda]|uniref:PNPLA domain-containing protein n=1 Tax=Cladophialophora immunda TaxID=569365 RepID=A0A0D2B3T4_9EURO|nr:uncharacterized protein PV07_03827 [Cladophialophora immunda]KIW32267.1 hypothetical protein PV07_03827 [Cladophialophora immunda]